MSCLLSIPFTLYEKHPKDNPVFDRFAGKFALKGASAMYHFDKGGKLQKAIHHLKYKHKPYIGELLSKQGKHVLQTLGIPSSAEFIPVPLHPNKEKKRGYNQAYEICKGLTAAQNIRKDVIIRKLSTETQTKKSKEERYQNVEQAFEVKTEAFADQIVLVDDVVTTGATLETLARLILKKKPKTELWILALAHARIN
jgi:ComF family protein